MTGAAWFDTNVIPKLERMVGPKVAREIIDLYFSEAPKRLAAVRSGRLEEAARALHSLKSSAGMLGAFGLEQLAGRMERQASDRDGRGVAEGLGELEDAMERVDRLLRDALSRIEA